jgi:hypothetical protein
MRIALTRLQIGAAGGGVDHTRSETNIDVDLGLAVELQKGFMAAPREHVTILNTDAA